MSLASSICIAGYYFELKNKSEYPFAIEAGFEHFMVQNPMSADIRLQFYEGFLQLSLDKLLYRAKNGTQILWEIFAYHSQKLFLVYHPESGLLQQQAFYDAKTDIICRFTTDKGSWYQLAGRDGYVIVRNGQVTKYSILMRMS